MKSNQKSSGHQPLGSDTGKERSQKLDVAKPQVSVQGIKQKLKTYIYLVLPILHKCLAIRLRFSFQLESSQDLCLYGSC